MRKVMKIGRMSGLIAIVCVVVLASFGRAAQEDKPVREVYQAQAMGQSTQLGSFVRKVPTDDGYNIRILTNRPIRFGEAWVN
jgi:hypothetical protein